MPHHTTVKAAGRLLLSRTQLLDSGWTDRGIASAVAAGTLRRIRRGTYVDDKQWRDLWPEGQHLLEVLAVQRTATEPVVFAGAAAAVIHGLPLYRFKPDRVEVFAEASRRHSAPGILRHARPLDADAIVVDGLSVTSAEQTVADLAGLLPLPAAVAVADAGLRAVSVKGQRRDLHREGEWREAMDVILARRRGARGVRQARRVIAFADGRAQLPGESVSRLQLHRLGVRVTDLQVPVPGPTGGFYYPDFELGEVNAFGEFDGEGKYRDEALRSGRSLEQVLLDEKQREDWIRGTTGRRMPRWGDREAASALALGRRLASFGVPVRL